MEIVRRSTDAYNRRDVDGMLETWAQDAVLDWSNARTFDAGVYRGHGEIQAFMEGSAADTAGSMGVAERRKIQAGLRDELCRLLRSHGYQTERIGNLSTKLRLTKQSRYDASSAYRAAKDAGSVMKKPWLDWGENSSDRQQ